MQIKALGSTVDPLPPPAPTPAPGADRALTVSLPGGWRLSGGPADYTVVTAAGPLGDELGRFRGLKSYATAEYANLGQRLISVEVFLLSSTESAAGALNLGKPADAKPLTGADLDEGFTAGLRAEGRKGPLLVRVRWFDAQDEILADAAEEALRDVLEVGEKNLRPIETPTPIATPTPPAK